MGALRPFSRCRVRSYMFDLPAAKKRRSVQLTVTDRCGNTARWGGNILAVNSLFRNYFLIFAQYPNNVKHNDRQQSRRTETLDSDSGRCREQLQASEIILKKEYDALRAKNGREAVDFAMEHKPDAILMDIKMPVMDGIEALEGDLPPYGRTLPVIMQTAWRFDTDRRTAEEAAATDSSPNPSCRAN